MKTSPFQMLHLNASHILYLFCLHWWKNTITSELKYIQHPNVSLKWGTKRNLLPYNIWQSTSRKRPGVSSPLFCMSNKLHAVGKNVTVKFSCSVQLYSSHDGNSLSVPFRTHTYLCDSCISTICWIGSSWQVTSWISHSKWQLGDASSTFSQWVSSASSIHLLQLSWPQKQNVLVYMTVSSSGHTLVTLVLL